jgi:nucleoside-diphosphate-sugar epimerase
MDLGIADRTALVTGADSGIGWSTSKLLLAEGATVVMTDIDQALLDDAASRLSAPEGTLFYCAAKAGVLASDRASFVTGSNYRVDSGSVATI